LDIAFRESLPRQLRRTFPCLFAISFARKDVLALSSQFRNLKLSCNQVRSAFVCLPFVAESRETMANRKICSPRAPGISGWCLVPRVSRLLVASFNAARFKVNSPANG
jgi:hypothetical protein